MTDKLHPAPLKYLAECYFGNEYGFCGIPHEMFANLKNHPTIKIKKYEQTLNTPFGLAAGPHTQMAQNIVAGWLCGASFIELKTVQTLDKLTINKPCINMQDEGYNCEWSQELTIQQSFDEYLKAWVLIHLINAANTPKAKPEIIFNMSIGYNMEGIMQPNMQWFLSKMNDCTPELNTKINEISELYNKLGCPEIPTQISNNVTLSTMHGCPPSEIEQIGSYLIEKLKLHTTIKLNPTLAGKQIVRELLLKTNFDYVDVPNEAFEHDLKYEDAIKIIENLNQKANDNGVCFGLKLTNTLETNNNNNNLPPDENPTIYMSGRALHTISVWLANKLQNQFEGQLQISFAGGADCFNIDNLVAAGMSPVTVCSDLLKPGGYGRLGLYIDTLEKKIKNAQTDNINDFVAKTAKTKKYNCNATLNNLKKYTEKITSCSSNIIPTQKPNIKTNRNLYMFDCINAPCVDKCPTNQDIPTYLKQTANGQYRAAYQTILKTNPFPNTTGMICDQTCQLKCTRINYDSPIEIRDIKLFVANANNTDEKTLNNSNIKVAVIGGGPAGLSCANFLALNGITVDVFEKNNYAGGLISAVIPDFRLTDKALNDDIEAIVKKGVNIIYNKKIDKKDFEKIYTDYNFVYIAIGAENTRKLKIQGADCENVIDAIIFLENVKQGQKDKIDKRVVVIGGGNSAMDAARTALRLTTEKQTTTIIYRRTIAQMPADRGEIEAATAEGAIIKELLEPIKITKNIKTLQVTCRQMQLSKKDDSGRASVIPTDKPLITIDCEMIITALGQEPVLNFVPENLIIDKNNIETSDKKIFIGGDALHGAATAIEAIADGKNVAFKILEKINKPLPYSTEKATEFDYKTLMLKKYVREKSRINKPKNNTKKDFSTYRITMAQAHAEAARCLQCDLLCNICITVCPNLANISYRIEPLKVSMKKIVVENGQTKKVDDVPFIIEQKYQTANIADWCNECGNCATFCPTAGKPYTDKPRIHISKKSFEESISGFFVEETDNITTVKSKENMKLSTLIIENQKYIYSNENIECHFSFENKILIEKISLKNTNNQEISLHKAMQMFVAAQIYKQI